MAESATKIATEGEIRTGGGSPADKPSLRARLRYRFDAALSRGPSVVIAYLGILSITVILLGSAILTVFQLSGVGGDGNPAHGLGENFFLAMTRVLDPGTFAGENGWPTRMVMLAMTIAGIFIVGSLIGLIANSVDQQIEELRKGRSTVLETDHTLILGWSSRVPAIVNELVIANESRKSSAVVILADVDKTEMEETLRDAIDDTKSTRIVCRSGEPWSVKNLELANLGGARSIVIVGDGKDSSTVKSLLAIRSVTNPDGTTVGPSNIVAEVVDNDTAISLRSLLGSDLVTVSSDAVVAELTAQACRQRGLSTVFRELLDFDGDELYFAPFPELVGKTYAETQMAFEKCAVMGVLKRDGGVRMNPAPSELFEEGDQLIAVVEDDSLFLVGASPASGTVQTCADLVPSDIHRRIVIAGWSALGPRVISELDEFLDPNTTIELMLDPALVDVASVRDSLSTRNVTLEVSELGGGPEFVAAHAARRSFHEVIVLGYREALDDDEADARTLLTLLAFNQVRHRENMGPVRIVAEMLDQRNAMLAQATGVDDFVVSDELTSLMLAQLSERGELNQVFTDLFDRDGCSIELRKAPLYGAENATTFADVVVTASSRGHSAIGYRVASSGVVVVNPAKSERLSLTVDDEIVVLAPAAG